MGPADVRIGIVVPWIHGVRGHRIALNLSRELSSRGARVDFFVGSVYEGSNRTVTEGVGGAQLHVGRLIPSGDTSVWKFARYQYSRSLDRKIARAIATRHAEMPFDLVFVVANEGHWLAGYLRKFLSTPRPVVALCVRELVEHPFWLGYERPGALARTLASPLYPLAHAVERQRLQEFDLLFSISPWTTTLLDYFYGIRKTPSLILVDRSFFEVEPARDGPEYVAVPTASLDEQGIRLVQRVHERIPNLRTFGKRPVPGLPHEGFLSDSGVAAFLSRAAATLFIFDYEALGLIPLESLATGTPVVTQPKQGPYSVLRGNPFVRFGESASELSSALAELMRISSKPEGRRGSRESVSQFRPDLAVEGWLDELSARTDLGEKLAPLRSSTAARSV
jgi:glycosyltransferase involved in cell wall biosynthesis